MFGMYDRIRCTPMEFNVFLYLKIRLKSSPYANGVAV